MTFSKRTRTLLLGLALLGISGSARAQQEVEYPILGLRFEVPAGWHGQEGDGMYLIQKSGDQSLLVLMPHEATTRAELEAGAREGIHVADGSSLEPAGHTEPYGAEGVRVDMAGLVEWAPVEAHVIGLLSPYGGPGVAVLSIAPQGQFSEAHRGYAETVAESVVFTAPETPPIVEEWAIHLRGALLSRYGTRSGFDDSSSSAQKLSLCDGYFHYTGSYSGFGNSPDGSGVSIASHSEAYGTWSIAADAVGTPLLSLRYEDGSEETYELAYEDGRTYLDGQRVLVSEGDCQ